MAKDKYEELACDLVNEADVEEQLDEEGLSLNEVEEEHFQDSNYEGYKL